MTCHPQTETPPQSSVMDLTSELCPLLPLKLTHSKCEALLAVACSRVRHITLHIPATEGLMISSAVAYVI